MVYFSDVLSKIPISTTNPEHYLEHNKFDILTDSTGIYLVRFKKYKIKDSVSLNFRANVLEYNFK